MDLLRCIQSPDVEIDVLDENTLDFLFFMTTFQQAVEEKIDDERGRLRRVLKYMIGEPKELVKGCIYLSSKHCYQEAKYLLYYHYGDAHRILSEFKKQIRDWPDSKQMMHPHTKVFMHFSSAMAYSGNNKWFDSPYVIQTLHSKLPFFLQDR